MTEQIITNNSASICQTPTPMPFLLACTAWEAMDWSSGEETSPAVGLSETGAQVPSLCLYMSLSNFVCNQVPVCPWPISYSPQDLESQAGRKLRENSVLYLSSPQGSQRTPANNLYWPRPQSLPPRSLAMQPVLAVVRLFPVLLSSTLALPSGVPWNKE